MKLKNFLFVAIGFSPFCYLTAQTLKGQVVDEQTNKALPGALLIFKKVAANVKGEVLSNNKGIYLLPESFEKGNYEFEISLKGYKTKSFCILFRKDTVLDIPLALNVDEKKF